MSERLSSRLADDSILVRMRFQPRAGQTVILFPGMEIGAQIIAPRPRGLPDKPPSAEQEGRATDPRFKLPQLAIAREVVERLTRQISCKEPRNAPEPFAPPSG